MPDPQDWFSLAYDQVGKPYIWGSGSGAGGRGTQDIDPKTGEPRGFDCSGFVSYVYKNALGVDIPAFTGTAYTASRDLKEQEDPRPGDLVFWNMNQQDPRVQHIGIYAGNGKVIQSGGTGAGVNLASVSSNGPPTFRRVDKVDPERLAAAEPTINRVLGASATRTGAPAVADNPKRVEMQRQLDQAEKDRTRLEIRVQEAQRRLVSVPANGLRDADRDARKEAEKAVTDAQDALEKHDARIDKLKLDISGVKDDETAVKPPTTVSTSTTEPYIVRQDAQGNLSFAPNPNYRQAAAPQRRTQVVSGNLIDLDNGTVIAQLPQEARTRRTQVVGTMLVDLDTGQSIADLSAALAKPEKPTIQGIQSGGKVTGINTQTGEQAYQVDLPQDPETPRDVATPAGQQFLVRRRPDGTLVREPNPNYQAPVPTFSDPKAAYDYHQENAKAQAATKKQELQNRLSLPDGDPQKLSTDEARAEFGAWWQQNVEAPLAGYKAAADRQALADQLQMDTLQRTENQRAEGINRQREQYAYERGSQAADAWRKELPAARSTEFVNEYAGNVSRMGQGGIDAPGVRFTQAALTAPTPYVAPDAMAAREAARALAHISPAAAAQVGRPLPQIPQTLNFDEFAPVYGAPTA